MKRLVGLVMLTGFVLAAGCGPAPESGGGETATTAGPAEEGYRIGVVPKGLVHEFWLTVKAGAEAAAAEHDSTIVWNGPPTETEVATQISIIEDMISSGVDAIVMAACHEEALVDVLQRAVDKGIPVVTIDSGVKSGLPITFVATDNIEGARKAADVLAELIGGKGEVGLIPFVSGAATSELRERGFKEGLANHEHVKLVSTLYSESEIAKGMAVTEDMLTAHPELDGIFAANEPGAVGAAQALKARDKAGEVKLVAFDASPEEISALQDGVVQALIVQNPYQMGYQGVKAAIDAMEGREVPDRIDTGVTVVTMDNFNDPEVQKLLYPLGKK